MPQIALNRTAIVTIVGELVPCAMAQHVTVNQEPEFRAVSVEAESGFPKRAEGRSLGA